MKKIIMILAAMAAVLSSCSKSELESVSENECRDIVFNISVSDPAGDDAKALVKTAWANGDEISIWYDTNTGNTPDLVIKYDKDNGKWIQKKDAAVSGKTPSTGSGKYAKALYNGNVKVASKDDYTYADNTLTFNIENWVFLTEIQVVVYGDGIDGTKPSDYTLSCDKFTPCTGYSVDGSGITATAGTKGAAVTGISNGGVNSKPGVAFVFATAEYSSTAAYFKFTLTDNTSTPAVTNVYTTNTDKIKGTSGEMTSIKALTINVSKFQPLPEGALPGEFTVGKGTDGIEGTADDVKVHFSKGNLYYDGKTSKWGFEAEQYYFRTYCDGTKNGGKCDADGYDKDKGTAVGDWGLFGWSTSNNGGSATTNNYGMMTSTTAGDYSGNFYDWGKAIDNKGNWATLSGGENGEWKYLFDHHVHVWGTCKEVPGFFIAPDGYEGDASALSTAVSDWKSAESAGIVFLPVAGRREDGSTVKFVGTYGYYWSSSANGNDNAYYVDLNDSNIHYYEDVRRYGCSVRLITKCQ